MSGWRDRQPRATRRRGQIFSSISGRFRGALKAAAPHRDHLKGGLPPFEYALMFEAMILRAMHSLSDQRCDYRIEGGCRSHASYARRSGSETPIHTPRAADFVILASGSDPGCAKVENGPRALH